MIGYFATQVEIDNAENLLYEQWTYGTYPNVSYLKFNKNPDPAYGEEPNKSYTQLGTFPAELRTEPVLEEMLEAGENWQEGHLFVSVPRIVLARTYVNITPNAYSTLLSVKAYDDVLEVPTLLDTDNTPVRYRIERITNQGWFGGIAMMVEFQCIIMPASAR